MAGNALELLRGKEIRFLTLTIKTDGELLTESLDKLYKAFQALRRRRIWTRAVDGGVAFLENKWNEPTKRWHPHLHCLIEGRYIDKTRLAHAWYEVTGDSYIIDIRRPPNNATVARYVTKYAGKPFNNTFLARPELLDEAIHALRGRKLALTFGRWRGLKLTAVADDGCWEHVSSLQYMLQRAGSGDLEALDILKRITNRNLEGILPRSPPSRPVVTARPMTETQLSWLGMWRTDGTFRTGELF